MILKQSMRVALVIMSFIALIISFASGQEPEVNLVEAWKGKLLIDGRRPASVVFKIRRTPDGFTILTMNYKGKDFPVAKFSSAQDSISFTWKPGEFETHCMLHNQEEKGYVGNCQTSDSETKIGLVVYPQVPQEIATGSTEQLIEGGDP